MKKATLILLALLAIVSTSCTNEKKTREILQKEGYTDIKITGYDAFECSDQDSYSTGFCATNAAGNRVCGTVCGGLFKGYTIRYK